MQRIAKVFFPAFVLGWMGAVVAEETLPAASDTISWDRVSTRGRIEAEKAAFEDAGKKLYTGILNLQFGPQRAGGAKQFVSDFVKDYAQVTTAIEEFVKSSAQRVGRPRYLADLFCQVEVEVKTEEVVKLLETQRQTIFKDLRQNPQRNLEAQQKLSGYNFRYIYAYYQAAGKPLPAINVVGLGKPPDQFIRRTGGNLPPPTTSQPDWTLQTITTKGRAELTPEPDESGARTHAERAALLAAQYEALLKIHAIRVDEKTTIGDVVANDAKARATLFQFIVTEEAKMSTGAEGSVEVTLTLPLETFYDAAKNYFPAAPATPAH